MQVYEGDKIELLTHELHDLWINFDDLKIAESRDWLEIPLYQDGLANNQVRMLKIEGISRIIVQDEQGIGVYDINRIAWNSTSNRAIFKLNIPAQLEFEGACLRMTVS